MSWDIIHRRLLHSSDSVMKLICHHQTLDGLTKHFPKKIQKSQCTICYTAKITTINKGPTGDTSNLQPVEIVHIDFVFYNVTSIHGFTSILTVVCEKTKIIWEFPTASKLAPIHIISFFLTTLLNEQNPCKRVIFDEDSALINSTKVKNLHVDEFKISIETTGVY